MNSKDERVVCRCNMVSVGDVLEFSDTYPGIPKDVIRQALNIGTRCGCCRTKDCPIIDIKFENIFQN